VLGVDNDDMDVFVARSENSGSSWNVETVAESVAPSFGPELPPRALGD
jgi:hypothetical protein